MVDRGEPYGLLDGGGVAVEAARAYFGHLQVVGWSEATIRSYGLDLLRWFRFVWAAGVGWDQATRAEAREFCRWLVVAGKPVRPHWRQRQPGPDVPGVASGQAYAPSVRAHCETVLRSFYDFHVEAGTGPLVNPFPLDRSWRGGRAHAHRNPMEPYRRERSGLYRPVVPSRIPRNVPDEEFNAIFAALGSHRDRALVAFYVPARGAGVGVAVGDPERGGSGAAADHRGPEGDPGGAATARLGRCVRVAAAVSGADGRLAASRGRAAVVVDAAAAVPAAGLSRGAPHVRAGRRGGGHRRDAARAAAYRGLPDGCRSGAAAHRRAVRAGPRPADHHTAVLDAPQGGGDPPGAGSSQRAGPPGPAAGPPRPGTRLPARDAGCAVRAADIVTTGTLAPGGGAAVWPAGYRAARRRFPPRPAGGAWPATTQGRAQVLGQLDAAGQPSAAGIEAL